MIFCPKISIFVYILLEEKCKKGEKFMVKDIFQLARAGIAFEYEPVHKVHFMPPAPSVMIAEKENRKEKQI